MELYVLLVIPLLVAVWAGWKVRNRNRRLGDERGTAGATAEAERIKSQAHIQTPSPPNTMFPDSGSRF